MAGKSNRSQGANKGPMKDKAGGGIEDDVDNV